MLAQVCYANFGLSRDVRLMLAFTNLSPDLGDVTVFKINGYILIYFKY